MDIPPSSEPPNNNEKRFGVDVYAFVGWISSICVYLIFLLWAFCPEKILNEYGITYYPSRYYAIALPSYLIVVHFLVGVGYIGINMMNTFDPDDIRTVMDSHSRRAPSTFTRLGPKDGIPEMADMDWAFVSHLLASKAE